MRKLARLPAVLILQSARFLTDVHSWNVLPGTLLGFPEAFPTLLESNSGFQAWHFLLQSTEGMT